MSNNYNWIWGIIITTASVFINSGEFAIAQIIPDNTLPENSQVLNSGNNINLITGGTRAGNNLFHSFQQFSIPNGTTASFANTADVQNIISRVTGNSISQIDGTIATQFGSNLFLINPNGIVFGQNATLNIGGSFIASTASSINFADGKKFSATEPQSTPLLSTSIPIGLQFPAKVAPIRNQSQASPNGEKTVFGEVVGLKVPSGKTLALIGGDLILEGGNLTAESGHIELGSVAGNSLVSLQPTNQGWTFSYEGVKNFQNIQLIQRKVQNGSEVGSIVEASSLGSGGSIGVQGNIVELIGKSVRLRSETQGVSDGGDVNITSQQLALRDGAQVRTSTSGKGRAGNLNVNVFKSVELVGSPTLANTISVLLSTTFGEGRAGELTINTQKLSLQNGAEISSGSTGGFVLVGSSLGFQPATGNGGNLNINASNSVELIGTSPTGSPSSLLARTLGPGNSGKITVNTRRLTVRDGAAINVSSQLPNPNFPYIYLGNVNDLGIPGELIIKANSVFLDNQGKLTSNSLTGQGGNISLQVRNALLMRRNSRIATNAGTSEAPGNGGNITINAPRGFVVATPLGNNDITANAFSGAGGKITIKANTIFGFVRRDRADLVRILGTDDPTQLDPNRVPTSDITAFSQQNPSLNGTIQINTPDVDPSKGLLELPTEPVDASQQIVAACQPGGKLKQGSLVATGRGGIATSPTEPLMEDAVLAGWINLDSENTNSASTKQQVNTQKIDSVNHEKQINPAQGWVMDNQGNVTLLAQAPTVTPHSPILSSASCAAN
ncbi:filamentous hemagglutinin N-terminal domain-containing protein [Nostoc sp. FACHB-110]|uniref:filamentous hemagglutinin N-terminal domain-containing protein n=1 Tax=Nostoc sp. FACHB-110 TaxID=2692834 RepID=UPI001684D886|nr:filamentous hemagglutinin N-terminal domain-containing protein [Nostoc sp. FACHB-110]MBD2439217.1 filamentous hemagglutinin N-terminal domain-containing protein [Nostoc sp. FACHB-110]